MSNSNSITFPSKRSKLPMPYSFIRVLVIMIILTSICPKKTDGQQPQWCVADGQFPDEELQNALNWACENGADCSQIQENQPCYLPNTLKDHASVVFNSYYQRMKHRYGVCWFGAAAFVTAIDPSYGSCKFEYLP